MKPQGNFIGGRKGRQRIMIRSDAGILFPNFTYFKALLLIFRGVFFEKWGTVHTIIQSYLKGVGTALPFNTLLFVFESKW